MVGGGPTPRDPHNLCSKARFAMDSNWPGAKATTKAPCFIRPDNWNQACEDACKGEKICNSQGVRNGKTQDKTLEELGLITCFYARQQEMLAYIEHMRSGFSLCTSRICLVQDVFTIDTLMKAAGVDLDKPSYEGSSKTTRYEGSIINLAVTYNNIEPWHWGTVPMNYYYNISRQNDSKYKDTTITYQSTPVKTESAEKITRREMFVKRGLYFRYIATGFVGDTSFFSVLLTLTTSLTLFAVATTVTDFLMTYVLPERNLYYACKYEETDDFSDVRDAIKEGLVSKKAAIDDLKTQGSVVKALERGTSSANIGKYLPLRGTPGTHTYAEGDRVEGNFGGHGQWYGARVTKDHGDGHYDLQYNDGDAEHRVPARDLAPTVSIN